MNILKTVKQSATTLDQLRIGDSALVLDVIADDNPDHSIAFNVARRLKELGFIKGESVRILHRGYFGGEPLAVRIGQSTFALRSFEAALIGVAPAGCI